jgi:anti-sigma B factor antagonist
MRPPFQITIASSGQGRIRLAPCGELDIGTVPEFVHALQAQRGTAAEVTLDLSELEFIDSTGMRALLEAIRDAQSDGWNLAVRPDMRREVRRALDIAGLLSRLPLADED